MCGLTGFLSRTGSTTDAVVTVQAMTSSLHHRGPDAEGIWGEEGVALGHRRLAILDLSEAGAQPMHSDCGRYVIVFNGEIYNHKELRHQLATGGATPSWRGHSDTETLLAGIARWGLSETLSRSSGMFALAVWDRKSRRLQLARDRMGEKPLYWGWCGPDFVFSSELKALRRHPDCPKEVCREALAQYLRFAYVPAPRSIHPGIYKLEPGCILEIDGVPPSLPPRVPLRPGETHGTLSIRRYWSLNEVTEAGHRTQLTDEGEALEELETRLKTAVASQIVADVPLGAFLSGGIDSSLIVALMHAHSKRPVKTFTVGFENPAFDEAPYASAVARHLGTEHTEVLVTEREARDVILRLPDIYDEPFADSSQIPTHLVCRAAREHVTVALSGDGGDELFGGYNRYLWGPRIWSRMEWMPLTLRQALGRVISGIPVPAWDFLGNFLPGGLSVSHPGDKAHKLAEGLRGVKSLDDLYRNLVSEWPSATLVQGLEKVPTSTLDDPIPTALDDDPVGRMMFQDMRSYLPDDILCKVDRAAMALSLETRVPFLDPEVIKTAARLPIGMKIRNGQGKSALRQILYRHVPRELIERPKAGFGIPVGEWLRGPLKPWAEELLSEQSVSQEGLIDPALVRKAWQEHLSRRRDWTQRLWIILMFVAWREKLT
jgi:asparagine synthase (glutamine-hydrolysing)